jgi:hypothetical protein
MKKSSRIKKLTNSENYAIKSYSCSKIHIWMQNKMLDVLPFIKNLPDGSHP